MKRTPFFLAVVFCFSMSGLVLAGEIKIYSSEGVQTITVPDEEKDIGGNWIRLPQDPQILIMEERVKNAVQKKEAEKETVLEKKPQESLIKAKKQFEQTGADINININLPQDIVTDPQKTNQGAINQSVSDI